MPNAARGTPASNPSQPGGVAPSPHACAAGGLRPVLTIGTGQVPALLRACGLGASALDIGLHERPGGRQAWRLSALPDLLQAIDSAAPAPLLVRTDDPVGAAVFSALRQRMRQGDRPWQSVHALDLPTGAGDAAAAYRRHQLQQLAQWAARIGGRVPDPAALHAALEQEALRHAALQRLDRRRSAAAWTLGAQAWTTALLSALVLPFDEHLAALQALDETAGSPALHKAGPAARVFLAGALHCGPDDLARLDEQLLQVVGDDLFALCAPEADTDDDDPWSRLRPGPVLEPLQDPIERADCTVRAALQRGATRVIHCASAGDEREPWFRRWLQQACRRAGLDCVVQGEPIVPRAPSAPSAPAAPAAPAARAPVPAQAAGANPPDDGRSRKSLALAEAFSRHQRSWFQSIRQRCADGEPFAVINADAPQELLRAFDLPFVVNQWWASIVAAKQQTGRYQQLLRAQGYPTHAEAYSAQGLAAVFDDAPEQAPWGGLPRPGLLMAVNGTAATAGIYRSWAAETGARLVLFDRTAEKRVDVFEDWWDRLPDAWDQALEPDRLDLLEGQLLGAIDTLQAFSGRRYDEARLREVMALVNRQEDLYRRTRDLIAQAPRAPVGVVDTMPAVMVPQWHRGTAWGVQAAQALHDEVSRRVEQGQAACPGERMRLMWVGRGLWSRMAFYQQWEASHGAVFVWSMYLGLAADGYLRRCDPGQPVLRALASRFVTMGDELRMPTWSGAWHVKEARLHRADAAVAVDDADPMVLQALERAGVPVLRLDLGNFGAAQEAMARASQEVGRFLDALQAQRST